MRGYTVDQCVEAMRRKRVRFEERRLLDETYCAMIVKRNSLGIRLWGMIDFLVKRHGYFLVIE